MIITILYNVMRYDDKWFHIGHRPLYMKRHGTNH